MHATPLSSNTNCHLSTLYLLCISIIPIITHSTHQTIPPSPFLTLNFLPAHQPMSSFTHCTLSLYTTPPSYPLLGALHIHSLHPSTAMHGHALVMLFSTYLGSHASFIPSDTHITHSLNHPKPPSNRVPFPKPHASNPLSHFA